ncbi:TonB-dependent receptor [Novosphingobium sp.]|uniref:TonB-dependent receptor n=1 Tax=Novosphingobium sp. TaxID=1874826 RepID=UPI001ED6AACA|nr:TonB-dependent receptor [Novosphingobium sp.]MBK6802181.1 TonB-dependent receptor [Novosphingobium sp.]MBK9009762.1 TonB-dependent receptor [Novosphingobium sp.]
MRAHALLSRTSLLASAIISLTAMPAFAQDSADATASEDDGAIVVTARRREENLVDVPIAISALSGEQLAAKGAMDITALAETVPNVTLEASRATNSTLSAFIRGVGQQDPVSGFEQGVGIYLDDVYLNRPQAAVLDIYDVQRIEVLRGPQGTLYGRNTVGGAVKYVTKRLDDVAHVSARATYGSYDQADGVITASAPIGSGVLRVGGSLARLSRGGFGTNLTTGQENYNKDVWAARGTVEVHATDFFARISGDYTKDNSLARGGHRLIPAQQSVAPVLADVYDTRGALLTPKQEVKAWGTSLFMEGEPTDWLTFRSITSYRKDDSTSPIDFDALPSADLDVPGIYKNDQFSQEVQALFSSDRINGLVGIYYLHANALTQFESRLYTTAPGFAAYTNADIKTDTFAAFADFTVDVTDKLKLSIGGRYTYDQRSAYILRQNYIGGGSKVFGSTEVLFGAAQTDFRGQSEFRKFTPKIAVNYQPTPDSNIYASFTQGFKGGGFDPRGVGINAVDLNNDGVKSQAEISQFLSFRPETVDSYEVGYKADLFDRRVYVALAAFYMDYTDVQIPGSVACNAGGVATFCGVVSNAGKARMKGFELETRAKLLQTDTGTLTFTGSLGYIDAKYTRYITNIANVPTDVAAFRKVQNTPTWSGSASLDYAMDLAGGTLNLSGGMSFKSKTYQFEVPNPYLDQPAYQLFDASIVYRAPEGRWSLGVFGKNLTDKKYKTSGYNFMAGNATTGALTTTTSGALVPALGKEGVLTAFYGNPRQIFVTGTISF